MSGAFTDTGSHLELSQGVWVVSQTQWVECTTGVQAVQVLTEATWGTTVGAVALSSTHQQNLRAARQQHMQGQRGVQVAVDVTVQYQT